MKKGSDYKATAVQKCQDKVGAILLKALASCGVQVIFNSPKVSLKKLSDEEFRQCKAADMVISAEIHENVDLQHEEVFAVPIQSLPHD